MDRPTCPDGATCADGIMCGPGACTRASAPVSPLGLYAPPGYVAHEPPGKPYGASR